MLKKFVSFLIIFSLFYTDVANAMQSEGRLFRDDTNLSSHPSPLQHSQPLRRIKSSGDFSASQRPLHPLQNVSIPRSALPSTDSSHSNENLSQGSSNSSPTGSQSPSAIVANHSASPPMDLYESDPEGERCVSPQGSIQDFGNMGSGFSLNVFSSSSEGKKKDHLTERSPLLRQSASRSSAQELRSTNEEKRDSRELLIVRAKGTPSLL